MARFVSKHFTPELLSSNDFLQKNFPAALSETFFRMDELLVDPRFAHELQWLKLDPGEAPDELFEDPSHAGCTAIVALIVGDMLYLASAGDSRCLLGTTTGFSVPFVEHKPDNPQEKARILKAGGCVTKRRVCGNLNLSRAIGDFEYKTQGLRREQQMITAMPDLVEREIGDLEFLLLGSDGVWESKGTKGIFEDIKEKLFVKKQEPAMALEKVLEDSIAKERKGDFGTRKGGFDNVTGVLVVFDRFYRQKKLF